MFDTKIYCFSSFTVFFIILTNLTEPEARPWQKRVGRDVEVHHKRAREKLNINMWPAEPLSPENVDARLFKKAFGAICGPMPQKRLEKYVTSILESSQEFSIDPFVLAALIYGSSACLPKTPDNATKYGVTRIDVKMHSPHIKGGKYKYYVLKDGNWEKRQLVIDKYPFNKWKAAKIKPNIYFAAALLKIFKIQCQYLDKKLDGVAHRHYISHYFFGDRVFNTEPEDQILTIRRRLLSCYHDIIPSATGVFNKIPLNSPLDGTPRLVIDYFGNQRKKQNRWRHMGIDLVGTLNEPVRVVSDGIVIFSGIDILGAGLSKSMSPEQANKPRKLATMGPGGRYVAVKHKNGLRTYYMHLNKITVSERQKVKAGSILGYMGNSGSVSSGPHLHLEFRTGAKRIDPARYLDEILINPFK